MNVFDLPAAPAQPQQYLDDKQSVIDALPDYAGQVAKGKSLWRTKSKPRFDEIREFLKTMCVGPQRCNYCEDSAADEVEHIKPKDLYPEDVFKTEFYISAP